RAHRSVGAEALVASPGRAVGVRGARLPDLRVVDAGPAAAQAENAGGRPGFARVARIRHVRARIARAREAGLAIRVLTARRVGPEASCGCGVGAVHAGVALAVAGHAAGTTARGGARTHAQPRVRPERHVAGAVKPGLATDVVARRARFARSEASPDLVEEH